MPCSSVPADRFPAFLANLRAAFSKAEQRKGDERSAHGDERQGHQRTPAMILALMIQALEQTAIGEDSSGAQAGEAAEQKPRGGFTDVGLHTGGTPRDTAWPLVREVLKVRGHPPGLATSAAAHSPAWHSAAARLPCSSACPAAASALQQAKPAAAPVLLICTGF